MRVEARALGVTAAPPATWAGVSVARAGAGRVLAGAIFDVTTSYALALPIAAAMALLAPTLLWFVALRRPNPAPPAARSRRYGCRSRPR